jgi:hypothetical protein
MTFDLGKFKLISISSLCKVYNYIKLLIFKGF